MLYIRADMNENIATGHMMRCMSIADAARGMGSEVLFITSDHKGDELLKANGFDNYVLNSDYLNLMQGIEDIEKLVTEEDVLLIDTYSKTKDFMDALRGKVYTAYIDDMGEQVFNVDCIICYPPYYPDYNYEARYDLSKTKFILGPNYAPLRKEFRNCKKKVIKESIENILIVSGGSDPDRVTPKLLESITSSYDSNARITAICGVYSGYYDELCDKYNGKDCRVNITPSTPRIKDYFDEADVVITAAGSTIYELCATGTPAIAYTYADNQMPNANAFHKLGLIPCIGDVNGGVDIYANCIKELNRLQDKRIREEISQRMQETVTGNGAENIARELLFR